MWIRIRNLVNHGSGIREGKIGSGIKLTLLGRIGLLRCRLWELVERKDESRTPVSLDQLDLDPRTGETAAYSGQVLSLTTPAGNKVSNFLWIRFRIQFKKTVKGHIFSIHKRAEARLLNMQVTNQ